MGRLLMGCDIQTPNLILPWDLTQTQVLVVALSFGASETTIFFAVLNVLFQYT
jgi:hypothetical protein